MRGPLSTPVKFAYLSPCKSHAKKTDAKRDKQKEHTCVARPVPQQMEHMLTNGTHVARCNKCATLVPHARPVPADPPPCMQRTCHEWIRRDDPMGDFGIRIEVLGSHIFLPNIRIFNTYYGYKGLPASLRECPDSNIEPTWFRFFKLIDIKYILHKPFQLFIQHIIFPSFHFHVYIRSHLFYPVRYSH